MPKKENQKENPVETHLVDECKKYDIYIDKYIAGRRGVPDRLMIYNGKHVFAELKAPGKHPTELQLAVHELLRSYGADVRVIDSKEKADELVAELLKTKKPRKK